MTEKESTPKRFLRLPQIIGDLKADPPIQPIIPISRSAWFAGIKTGIYPKPVKLSARTSAWRNCDIDLLVDRLASKEYGGEQC